MTNHASSPMPLAVVAGASGAIGMAAAARLVAENWKVLGTYRRERPEPHPGVSWVFFDGTDADGATALRSAIAGQHGPLKAVICAVGAHSSKRPVAETPPGEFDLVYANNVTSVVRLWQVVAERARQAAAGVVVLSSDTTATLRPDNGAYSAAKASLEALSATLAAEEAAHGVRVNVLAPSLTDSPLAEAVLALKGIEAVDSYYRSLPWGRALSPQEVGAVAVEIATASHWSYASGQVVRLAGRGVR